MQKSLKELARLHEQVQQALLGAHWEERFALNRLKDKLEDEIRKVTAHAS